MPPTRNPEEWAPKLLLGHVLLFCHHGKWLVEQTVIGKLLQLIYLLLIFNCIFLDKCYLMCCTDDLTIMWPTYVFMLFYPYCFLLAQNITKEKETSGKGLNFFRSSQLPDIKVYSQERQILEMYVHWFTYKVIKVR